jgi:UDP-glucose 4-epimerase
MRVLVTGAGGFLGRHVVSALVRRGMQVRALDLAQALSGKASGTPPGVEEFPADLCESQDLSAACRGAHAVVHLAAKMDGDADIMVKTALTGTQRLIDAMDQTGVKRMVLASSLSVYDWSAQEHVLDEDSPLEPRPEERDAYTIAKLGQEQFVRQRCASSGIALTVLRPAMIWGRGREYPSTIGLQVGRLRLVIGRERQLPIVHVENCADAFAAVLEAGSKTNGVFNVVDHPDVTVRRFVTDYSHRSGDSGLSISAPYWLAAACVNVLHRLAKGPLQQRLPSFAAPARFSARYKPLRIDAARLRSTIGWHPPIGYQECLDRSYPQPSTT